MDSIDLGARGEGHRGKEVESHHLLNHWITDHTALLASETNENLHWQGFSLKLF